jgi:exodeoxyribonuclease VII large subunit
VPQRDEAAGRPGPFSVSEITAGVKALLEESLPFCWVEGEISECSRPASGHIYLTLADEYSQLSCVMFRLQAQQLRFRPERGMKVLVYGNVSVYERGGRYQFYAYRMQPSGVGDLAVAFEQLRTRLDAEGLFDAERKRPLPEHPRAIGVVTSPTGAAIRDIVQVLRRRAPGLPVILAPARVQGSAAPRDICRAIERLNRWAGVDILIVGRGGGSPEDLWPFNEESVARAIYRSATRSTTRSPTTSPTCAPPRPRRRRNSSPARSASCVSASPSAASACCWPCSAASTMCSAGSTILTRRAG